jgi:ubiquinol-cytochrome c reductase cytochrome b subunit
MGLAIANAVLLATPVIGGSLGLALVGAPFPGGDELLSRLYVAHVLLIPVAIGGLIALHLLFVALHKHSQFPGPLRSERNVVGRPLWPGYALRSGALALSVAAVLVLLGGLVQINPVWLWGPFEPWLATNGAQPDWYLGWLIGALRLMPGWEPAIGDYTLIPNPFFGGALFPLLVFGFLYAWPSLERRWTRDERFHHLLQPPARAPLRTAVGAAFFTLIGVVLVAGAVDRISVATGLPYRWSIDALRVLVFAGPAVAFLVARTLIRQSSG